MAYLLAFSMLFGGCSLASSALVTDPQPDATADSATGMDATPFDSSVPADSTIGADAAPDGLLDSGEGGTPDSAAADSAPDAPDAPDAALPPCRDRPDECIGLFGGFCDAGRCTEGECCTDTNCGSQGTCSQRCDGSTPCPGDMACEHGFCFFRCSDDADCFGAMTCEHDETICEW